jgi:antitoxin HigA-1
MPKTVHSLRDPKRKPTHPGAILREDVLPALRMTQTEFAQRLGVSRLTVSEILHEKLWELEQSGGYDDIEPVEVKAA